MSLKIKFKKLVKLLDEVANLTYFIAASSVLDASVMESAMMMCKLRISFNHEISVRDKIVNQSHNPGVFTNF